MKTETERRNGRRRVCRRRAICEAKKRKKFVTDYYNQEELNELFECVKGDLLEVPVILAAYYGLRRSVVLGLKWSAIRFAYGIPYVRERSTVRAGSCKRI